MKQILIPLIISIVLISVVFVDFENLEGQFSEMLTAAQENPGEYSGISFLVLSSDILLPVPSSIVMYSNGLVLGLLKGTGLSLISVLLSSVIGYYLGRISAFRAKADARTSAIMEKYGAVGIIITRGIPILSESIVFTAGYNRLSFKLFFLLSLIGYLPVCLVYAYFGNLAQDGNMMLISFFAALLVSLVLWFFGKKMISKFFQSQATQS